MARDNWPWIRLLLSDINVTYTEVINMDVDTVYMLNAALDIVEEQHKKDLSKSKRKL